MPIPDIEINEEFVVLVEDELESAGLSVELSFEDWEAVCQSVIKIARLRSGENFA